VTVCACPVESGKTALFVLDEVQKIEGWSETVKRLWDEDTARELPLHVMLLGSSPLLMQRGLTESLAGRFEVIPVTHWSFAEMREAFDWGLDEYIFLGGYPGGAHLINDPKR
jgi:predicted AAA+ superfamily ATPase